VVHVFAGQDSSGLLQRFDEVDVFLHRLVAALALHIVPGIPFGAADHFDLNAKLGFLLGAFSKTIESEIEKNLDALLAGGKAAAKKAAAKKK